MSALPRDRRENRHGFHIKEKEKLGEGRDNEKRTIWSGSVGVFLLRVGRVYWWVGNGFQNAPDRVNLKENGGGEG